MLIVSVLMNSGEPIGQAIAIAGPSCSMEDAVPRVYPMSSSGSRSGYEALVTQQTAKREIVSPKFDPKMDRLAVVLRQASTMASHLILLRNHSVESGGSNRINDIGLLTRLAIYADPAKLRPKLSKQGTIAISRKQLLSSQYSSADLQEVGLSPSAVLGWYINLID